MKWTLTALLLLVAIAPRAEVAVRPTAGKALDQMAAADIVISGTITTTDVDVLARYLSDIEKRSRGQWTGIVDLDSKGGSIDASLAIGRLLRQHSGGARVLGTASCLSACVYALAGAPRRVIYPGAQIGIHRPYDPDDRADSPERQRLRQERVGQKVRAYLREMNLPLRLYEDAQFVAPDTMRLLSRDELQAYGLSENDPFVDESDEVREAKRLGLTRAELGRRKAIGRVRCGLDRMNDDTPLAQQRNALICQDEFVRRGR